MTTIFTYIATLDELPASHHWLHPGEREFLQGLKFEKRRNDWLLGRWTAKQGIMRFSQLDFSKLECSDLEIRKQENGAPLTYVDNQPLPIRLSLSHSHGRGFCSLSLPDLQHGCDLEKIDSRSLVFIQDYFTERECSFLLDQSKRLQMVYANLLWSAKESLMKATETGLRIDPRSIEIETPFFAHEEWHDFTIVNCNISQRFFGKWKMTDQFVYTIVSAREIDELKAL